MSAVHHLPAQNARVVVQLPTELIGDIEPVLIARGLSLDEVVRLYLRSLVNADKRRKAVALADDMPIGKFKGSPVETVIRMDPGYVAWLTANVEGFRLEPDALKLVEAMQGSGDSHV